MSTLPLSAADSPFLPVGREPCTEQRLSDKRAAVLKHVARSERLVSVRPASQLEVRPMPEMLLTGIAELDAIAGAVLRAGRRHGIDCPTIERLTARIAERAGIAAPATT